MNKTKYIFITGGVVSGLGKGITAASLGRLLKSRGLKVTAQKLDPYLNVDPGTQSSSIKLLMTFRRENSSLSFSSRAEVIVLTCSSKLGMMIFFSAFARF